MRSQDSTLSFQEGRSSFTEALTGGQVVLQ